jgi:two-component system cell cycle response regulator
LVELAEVLRRSVRSSDMVGRWGGEEFLVLCPESYLGGAMGLAEKLRLAIADHEFEGVGRGTASFGVASLQPGDDVNAILGRADRGLYAAKDAGRNCVITKEVTPA